MQKYLKFFLAIAIQFLSSLTIADDSFITIASTTSTDNSGLFDTLLPAFTKESGIKVRVVAVGTGKAIKLARNGDADVLFVHHKPSGPGPLTWRSATTTKSSAAPATRHRKT